MKHRLSLRAFLLLSLAMGYVGVPWGWEAYQSWRLKKDGQKADDKNVVQHIAFDQIKLEIKKGISFEPGMIPSKIYRLDNRRARIKGFIDPSSVFQQKGITRFLLIRDNQR